MSQYQCYLLMSESEDRTYVGVTNNIRRRLRQHNGEITGGAKATRAHRPWRLVCVIQGFPDYRAALQFEYGWKHTRSSTGSSGVVMQRLECLSALLQRDRWSRNAPPMDTLCYRLSLRWLDNNHNGIASSVVASIQRRLAMLAPQTKLMCDSVVECQSETETNSSMVSPSHRSDSSKAF